MKKILVAITVLLISFSTLTGCAGWTNRDTGVVAGGVLGGVAGSAVTGGNPLGIAAGAVGGAVIGNEVAR